MMEREKASIQELMTVVNEMMWNTEFAMRSYMMLRPSFVRPGARVANGGSSNPSAGAPQSASGIFLQWSPEAPFRFYAAYCQQV